MNRVRTTGPRQFSNHQHINYFDIYRLLPTRRGNTITYIDIEDIYT